MGRTRTPTIKIVRTSIHTFLKHYNYFTSVAFLALPFSASFLLSSSLSLDPLSLRPRLRYLFHAAGFPPESKFFSILNLKLSQTIISSLLILPFTLSSLLLAKTSIIHPLNTHHKPPISFAGIFNSVLQTQLWNSFVVVSANATTFWVLFIAFNCVENLNLFSSPVVFQFLSIVGGITYSMVVANVLIICNLASILSGMEMSGGFISILKACVMIKGRTSTALSLALPINMALTGIEALFQLRVGNAYSDSGVSSPTPAMVLEGFLIAYLYSILITIDTISGCVFFKSCKIDYESGVDEEQELGNRNGEDGGVFACVKCSAQGLS